MSGAGAVAGDRLMVRRALGNLLSNAVRHAKRDSVVRVLIGRGTNSVEVSVENEGEAIDETAIPRLFDRFFRTQKSRPHPEHSGTGLGLAITKSIMTLHGGAVRVASGKKNTSFTLVFKE
jgi:signal transduction histidine kinase